MRTPPGGASIVTVHVLTTRRRRRLHELLPDGVFVLLDTIPAIVIDVHLTEWKREGYRRRRARPSRGTTATITPPPNFAAFRAAHPVQLTPSYTGSASIHL